MLVTSMNEAMEAIEQLCQETVSGLDDPIKKNTIESYQSNLFGTISVERHGQEAVYHWIDTCVNNGMDAIFLDYDRIYKPWLPPGMQVFL